MNKKSERGKFSYATRIMIEYFMFDMHRTSHA